MIWRFAKRPGFFPCAVAMLASIEICRAHVRSDLEKDLEVAAAMCPVPSALRLGDMAAELKTADENSFFPVAALASMKRKRDMAVLDAATGRSSDWVVGGFAERIAGLRNAQQKELSRISESMLRLVDLYAQETAAFAAGFSSGLDVGNPGPERERELETVWKRSFSSSDLFENSGFEFHVPYPAFSFGFFSGKEPLHSEEGEADRGSSFTMLIPGRLAHSHGIPRTSAAQEPGEALRNAFFSDSRGAWCPDLEILEKGAFLIASIFRDHRKLLQKTGAEAASSRMGQACDVPYGAYLVCPVPFVVSDDALPPDLRQSTRWIAYKHYLRGEFSFSVYLNAETFSVLLSLEPECRADATKKDKYPMLTDSEIEIQTGFVQKFGANSNFAEMGAAEQNVLSGTLTMDEEWNKGK